MWVWGGVTGSAAVVDDQLGHLDHRGPDAHGRFERAGAVIAQNRLAIIDLETGDPSISNEDCEVGAILNGEIYNFHALRGKKIGSVRGTV